LNTNVLFYFTGTIAPARETSEKENPLLAMLMNLNLVVPAAAAILVIIAAIVVICVIKGRNNGHKGLLLLFSSLFHGISCFILIFSSDDVIYNQASASHATMKRNGGDMRDELGYIPPPNRKLPPVPGTQYNTCDRIKRGNYSIQSIFHSFYLFFYFLIVDSSPMVCHECLQCTFLSFKFSFIIKKRKKEQMVVDD
jgi:hypothetical protein